jgi:hypothetical protein
MSKATDILDEVEKTLEAAKAEMIKFDQKGIKVAGGKLRMLAQTSKKLWQDLRIEVMATLKAAPKRAKKTTTDGK